MPMNGNNNLSECCGVSVRWGYVVTMAIHCLSGWLYEGNGSQKYRAVFGGGPFADD